MTTFHVQRLALVLVFAVVAAAAATTAAGEPKHRKAEAVEVKAVERRFTGPAPAAAAGPATAANAATRPAGSPGVPVEDFLRERAGKRREITDSQIAKMRRLVAITPNDDPQRPDFLFRLGELQVESQRFYSDRARELDQKIFDAPGGAKGALQAEQQRFETLERQRLLEAVKAFVAAARYPRYERMDEVLFRLAYLLTSVKKEAEAREFLLRLIKDHPTSRYVPDAYLAFAELYFEQGEMESALRFYEKVEQFPTSAVFPYAAYKKGWCHVNRGDFKTALESFVGVVRAGAEGRWKIDPRQKDLLVKEARKDIVKAYAHVGSPEKAWEFFRRTGGADAPKMMEALAELYWEHGKAAESTRIYRKMMAEDASSPRLCAWQSKVLRNTGSSGDKRAQIQELERLGAVHDKLAAEGGGGNSGGGRQTADACGGALHDVAKELALVWHREAQKTKNADTYALGERAYRLFLQRFSDDKDAYEMGFYYGELLWVLGRWQDAALRYTQVVQAAPKGKYLRDAAFAAVLAWKNALEVEDQQPRAAIESDRQRMRGRESQGRLAPQPIPPLQQKMIAAFHTYARHVPDAPELPVMLYREAYIHYQANQFDRAAELFRAVVDRYPDHPLAIYSANLVLDVLNAQGKTDQLTALVDRFLETPALMIDAETARQMISLKSDLFEREARAHEKRGGFKECGRSFLAAADALPAHRQHAERQWNAAQCFQNAHLVGQAVKAWRDLIDTHPADPLAQRALYRIAAGHQQLAFYAKAAEHYEEFARRFPGERQAATALGNAAAFRVGLGESERAIADMDSFVKLYGARQPEAAAGVFFQIAGIHEKDRQNGRLGEHLRSYLARWGDKGGVDRQVLAHFRLGELAWNASCPRASEDGACLQVKRVAATRGQELLDGARRKLKKRSAQCGPLTKSQIVVLDRDRRQAAEAEAHFRAAIDLWRRGGQTAAAPAPTGGGTPTAADSEARRGAAELAVAGATFYLAEREYEDLLRVTFPQQLDFSRPSPRDSPRRRAAVEKRLDDSNRRFSGYLSDKANRLESARARFLDVFKMRQAQWTIAAAARIGQLHQDFASQLYTAPIPADLADTDAWGNHPRDLYCQELEDRAGKIEAQAVDGFESCLKAATAQSWFSEWSRLCERELNQMKPLQFPLASEMKPEPTFAPLLLSAAPAIADLEGGGPTRPRATERSPLGR